MPVHGKLSSINLLPKDSFESSNLGRFLRWSLKTGRVLVVLTEFVVILAFGSRFWFDKRSNDLMEMIDAKHAVVRSFIDVEIKMRDVLSREEKVDEYLSNDLLISNWFEILTSATPDNVVFTRISSAERGKVTLSGVADSEISFAGLLDNLVSNPLIKKIIIKNANYKENKSELGFDLVATIDLKTVK